MKAVRIFTIAAVLATMIICMSACGTATDQEPSSSSNDTEATDKTLSDSASKGDEPEDLTVELNDELLQKYAKDDKEGFFDADFSPNTDITFSAGDGDGWNYSHNKREFPIDQCYSKIYNTAITKHFWGKKDEIDVFFIFTGTDKCDVELAKGLVDSVDSEDTNVTIYKKTLYAAKEKKAETVTSEFTISPKEACGLRVDVIYDSSVPRKYDVSSTIHFSKDADQ